MRLFLAVKLPEPARRHLAEVAAALKGCWQKPDAQRWPAVSWTKESNLHVTLKFHGEVPDARLPELCDALGQVPLPPPALRLFAHGLQAFPSPNAARVLAARVLGDVERLATLYESIESQCSSLGFPRENRRYRPHVTLGRPRVPLKGAWPALESAVESRWPGPEFHAESFSLVQSRLNPAGSIYTTLATFPRRQETL